MASPSMSTESESSAVECAARLAPNSARNITALIHSTIWSTRRWRVAYSAKSQQAFIVTQCATRRLREAAGTSATALPTTFESRGGNDGSDRASDNTRNARTDDRHDGRPAGDFRSRASPTLVARMRPGQGSLDADHQRHRPREDPHGPSARGTLRIAYHGIADGTAHRGVAGRARAAHRRIRRAHR